MARVDLIWLGHASKPPAWPMGRVYTSAPSPKEVAKTIDMVCSSPGDWVLLWDSKLGQPARETVVRALSQRGDLWHAGLALGLANSPEAIDFVAPSWMWNNDPDPSFDGTSWRLSLRCCLMPRQALQTLGNLDSRFETLEGAGLELGHRYARGGILVRYLPWLAPSAPPSAPVPIPINDQILFLVIGYGRFWALWALVRGALSRRFRILDCAAALSTATAERPGIPADGYHPLTLSENDRTVDGCVSVIIPTVDRYPYLKKLLEQLCGQTVRPREVFVVDQTAAPFRDPGLYQDFERRLPLRVIWMNEAGQCRSRNAALQEATGDYFLLLDDDIEVRTDFIENHLRTIARFQCDASCGVLIEDGAGRLPHDFTYIRASDVFPASNTMVSRGALRTSGLFDLAYDRRERADADLGIRLHRAGALLVLNPALDVVHRRALRGGLRNHKARVITYASSRQKLLHRHLPSISEIYYAQRYFQPRQVTEMLWLRAAGTISCRGDRLYRMAKAIIGAAMLPDTIRKIVTRREAAVTLSTCYPQIPQLRDIPAVASRTR